MKTEYKQYTITTPDNFQKVPLPGFQAWYDALMKNPKQGKGVLCADVNGIKEYCCLGVLSETQGRLKLGELNGRMQFLDSGGMDKCMVEYPSNAGLSEDNPLRPILSGLGSFPPCCSVNKTGIYNPMFSFAMLNDSLEMPMIDIAEVLNTFYKNPE